MAADSPSRPEYRLDDIDRRIIYELMQDARNTTATAIAEAVNVSQGTIHNRLDRLEDLGILTGYTATVDFEQVEGRLTSLYLCTVPMDDSERIAKEVEMIPEVIGVRALMSGQRNLHVVGVGESTEDFRRIARTLLSLDVEIENKELIRYEAMSPYGPFGPGDAVETHEPADFISLHGDANVIETTVEAGAPIAGRSLREATENELLEGDALVVAVEQDGAVLTPDGDTVINAEDVVTVLYHGNRDEELLRVFLNNE